MSLRGQDLFNEQNDGASRRVLQQIEEVIALTMSINRILEDCSIQWKSTISKKQWKMMNCRTSSFSWQNSIVARTYFENEDVDNAFQNLLKSKAMFTSHLSHFMHLLNGQVSSISGLEIKNQDEMTMNINVPTAKGINTLPGISVMKDRINDNIQRTFSELLKAKEYFDKTLTSLSGIVSESTGSSTIDSLNCVCQICSNVLEENKSDKDIINIASDQRRRKSKRNKIKRLNSNNRQQFTSKLKNAKAANKKDYSAGDQNQTQII